MFWERNLRSVSKTPFKKNKDNSPSGKKDALRRAMRKTGNGGGGGGWGGSGGGGGGRGGKGADGRPSVGTWTKAQNYLQILKELSGKVGFVASILEACAWKHGVRIVYFCSFLVCSHVAAYSADDSGVVTVIKPYLYVGTPDVDNLSCRSLVSWNALCRDLFILPSFAFGTTVVPSYLYEN